MYGRCHQGENETRQNWKQGRCGHSHTSHEGGCGHRRGCEQESVQNATERKAWLEERKAHLQSRLEEINTELAKVETA